MSQTTVDAETLRTEEGFIAANLHTSMLMNFLMGIYTIIYAATVYLYLTKSKDNSQRRTVLSAITALYLLCALDFGLQWYFLKWTLVSSGATRASAFIATTTGIAWINVTTGVLEYSVLVVSDGLLIWRCFHLWGRSWRVIAFPLFLTVSEFALIIPLIITNLQQKGALFDALSSTFFFASSGSTITTTSLIGYRVHGATAVLTGNKAKSRFRHIFHVLFQSAALYAAVVFVLAINTVILSANSSSLNNGVIMVTDLYIETILINFAGMMPTILVALIIASRNDNTDMASITHISGLHFQSSSQPANLTLQLRPRSHNATTGGIHLTDLEIGTAGLDEAHAHEKEDGESLTVKEESEQL